MASAVSEQLCKPPCISLIRKRAGRAWAALPNNWDGLAKSKSGHGVLGIVEKRLSTILSSRT
jgi:hypothetical protein